MIFWYMYMLSNDEINTISLFITLNIYPFLPYGENIQILLVILKRILDISRKFVFVILQSETAGVHREISSWKPQEALLAGGIPSRSTQESGLLCVVRVLKFFDCLY